MNDSGKVIIAEIKTRKHPDADRLQIGEVLGHQVICGLDVVDGDIHLFAKELKREGNTITIQVVGDLDV